MNQINTDCFGCKYNRYWRCVKDGICTGPIAYETYVSHISETNYIPSNTSIMPDELIINNVKYRRVEDNK